jgi:iron complex outermembrane receptor protein
MKVGNRVLFFAVIFAVQCYPANKTWAQKTVFDLGEVLVSDAPDSEQLDISEKARIDQKSLKSHKVVDLAEILSDELVEASMIRKSGYGNEVGLRGFTKSNLRFSQDETLIEGSCGSRKDPPLSHINLLTIDKLEVNEGPYDVRTPGALGGDINVITKDPQEGFHGDILSKFGSFDYLSQGGFLSGGTKLVQGLFGYNYSRSGQYHDGAGNRLTSFNPNYNQKGQDMAAFEKHDFWGKIKVEPAKNHEVTLTSSYGRGNDILTPRVAMDTEIERNYFNKLEYSIKDLGRFSDRLSVSGYYNRIEHYPSGKFRIGLVNQRKIQAISYITGARIENEIKSDIAVVTGGLDYYYRNWYGEVMSRVTEQVLNKSLFPDVNELDFGAYLKAEKDIGKLSVSGGLRADIFHTKADRKLVFSRAMTDENGQTEFFPSANIFLKYFFTKETAMFGGVGLSTRTPTGCERYVQESAAYYGNPDLKPAHNFETDAGFETAFFKRWKIKAKGFYSYLKDFIYQTAVPARTYTNIDAYMIGGDIKSTLDLGKGFELEGGLAYQYGAKYKRPAGNNDKDLAEVAPMKIKAAINYDRKGFFSTLEWVHSNAQKRVDIAAGEVHIKGWDVFNVRAGYAFDKSIRHFEFLNGAVVYLGIDNILDRNYAMANSYEYDPTSTPGANVRIVNEPGRFMYASLSYKF